jgi:hypothetical protein
MSQKNKAATAPQIITNGIWTAAVFENFVVSPHKPFESCRVHHVFLIECNILERNLNLAGC